MSAIRKLLLPLGLLALVLPVVSVVGTGTASAGLSDRNCANFPPSNNRQLSICVQVWTSDSGIAQSRGVVVMHSYRLVSGGRVDSVAQSITVNSASFYAGGTLRNNFGQDVSPTTCRVNGPSSSLITCSVPNTDRVVFYGPGWNSYAASYAATVWRVSFRDDTGVPHVYDVNNSLLPLSYP